MKNIKIIGLAIATFWMVGTQAQNLQTVSASYFKVSKDLVASDADMAKKDAEQLVLAISKTEMSSKDDLLKLANKLAKTTDIERQRKIFADLSTQLWPILKADSKVAKTIYYQYCPMKQSYWISETEEVLNPYYGASMLHCGSIKEVKKATDAKK